MRVLTAAKEVFSVACVHLPVTCVSVVAQVVSRQRAVSVAASSEVTSKILHLDA